jgi:hypothetical protein
LFYGLSWLILLIAGAYIGASVWARQWLKPDVSNIIKKKRKRPGPKPLPLQDQRAIVLAEKRAAIALQGRQALVLVYAVKDIVA